MAKRTRVKQKRNRGGRAGGDPEFTAMQSVYLALKDLEASAQNRVLDYVFRRLSLTRDYGAADFQAGTGGTETAEVQASRQEAQQPQGAEQADGLEGISSVAQKWMRRNELTTKILSGLFSLGVDEIDLVANKVPGKNKKQKLRNIALLLGIASYLGTGAARINHVRLKEASGHYGAQDPTNFAKYMKELSLYFTGNREGGYSLTPKGMTAATELVKEMVTAKS
jgi:hypothetical protein